MTTPRFINVDLDIETHEKAEPLIRYLDERLLRLGEESNAFPQFVTYELMENYGTAEETIALFCAEMEALPSDLYVLWQLCPVRALDIGFDSGTERPASQGGLPADLLGRVVAHFTAINWTIYPV
jgi:hypothetical protein